MHTYTWNKLVKNTHILRPWTPQPTPRFEKELIIPYVGTKSVLVKLKAWGVTEKNIHNVTLLFGDCEILTGDHPELSLRQYFKLTYLDTVYYIKKFSAVKNPLTWRCDCFSGDTKVLLADGTYKTFKELEGQKDFDIISYNPEVDKFEIVQALSCDKKRDNASMLRIQLDNNTYIDCTPDHKFLLKDGQWVSAKDLNINDSLRVLYATKNNNDKLFRLMPDNKKQIIQKHKAEQKFYVYIYLDPRYPGNYSYTTCSFNYKPIYVGRGCGRRFLTHLKSNETDHFHNTLKKLQSQGLEPIILKQQEYLNKQAAFLLEKKLTEEIGLECEGKGPLLNCKHGGEGGLSGSAKTHVQQRMKNNNPMKNKESKEKSIESRMNHLTKEERVNIATKASHSRTEETWEKIKQTKNSNPEIKEKERISGKKLGSWVKQHSKDSNYHTKTKEFKEALSIRSKNNWKNEDFRNKVIPKGKASLKKHLLEDPDFAIELHNKLSENGKKAAKAKQARYAMNPELKDQASKRCLITKACKGIIKTINTYGKFTEDGYNQLRTSDRNMLTLQRIKEKGIFEESLRLAEQNSFVNHKVVKIEKIENQDVYCLTASYLGNFVVDCSNSNIISGVVVSNCSDAFYTWSWASSKYGNCLYGPPPRPYKRKTKTRPPRNPRNLIGVCKHVHNAWYYLRNAGLTLD